MKTKILRKWWKPYCKYFEDIWLLLLHFQFKIKLEILRNMETTKIKKSEW